MTTQLIEPTAPQQSVMDLLLGGAGDTLSNAVLMVYGDTGTGKTTLEATYCEYNWETYKKVTRVYTTDQGGFPSKMSVLMRLGIAQVWRMRNHVEPFETCELASLGWWPSEMDYRTGLAHPQVKLVPPVSTQYQISCPQGHLVYQTSIRGSIQPSYQCPTCRMVVTVQNWKVATKSIATPGFEKIGGACFDGITSWNDELMDDMAQRSARDELGGAGSALGKGDAGKIKSGDMVFGGNNQAHYGQAQTRSRKWLGNSAMIPGLVLPPMWTALEERATDDNSKQTIFGPKISGKAKTADVPSWVGNCLRATTRKDQQGDDEWRLYLRQHAFIEESNIPHLCKHRTDPDRMPLYLADPPEVKRDPSLRYSGFSMGHFFRLLTTALQMASEEAVAKYPDAPALTGDVPPSVDVRPEAAANYALSQVTAEVPANQQTTQGVTPVGAPLTAAQMMMRGTSQAPAQAVASPAAPASTASVPPSVAPPVVSTPPALVAPSAPVVAPAAPAAPAVSIPTGKEIPLPATAVNPPGAPLTAAQMMMGGRAATPAPAQVAQAAQPVQQTLPTAKPPSSPRPPVARGPKPG
jgi:hypothetical protein